jgi:methyl-accepting chemotaxis protein
VQYSRIPAASFVDRRSVMSDPAEPLLVLGWVSAVAVAGGSALILATLYTIYHQKQVATAATLFAVVGVVMILHPILDRITVADGSLDFRFRQATDVVDRMVGTLSTQVEELSGGMEDINQRITSLSRQIERLVRAGAEVTPRQREEIARSVAAITGRGAALSTELQAATQRTAQVRDLQTELRTIATERR